jgi:hypothetical protein
MKSDMLPITSQYWLTTFGSEKKMARKHVRKKLKYCKYGYNYCFWTLSIVLFYLFKTYNVSETGFCLRLKVKPTQLGPIDRASPYLQTLSPTQDRIYDYKLSRAQTIYESYEKH